MKFRNVIGRTIRINGQQIQPNETFESDKGTAIKILLREGYLKVEK